MAKKLNDRANNKKIKEVKYRSDEQKEVIRFIIILISIFVIVGAVYGLSKVFIKDNTSTEKEPVTGQINYDIVTVGTMFNRSENEYYVAIYKKTTPSAILYSSVINKYASKDKSLHVYFCDLENSLNSAYYVGEKGVSNPKAKTIDEVAFGDFTFVKIKNGKIVKYIENIDDAKKELGV